MNLSDQTKLTSQRCIACIRQIFKGIRRLQSDIDPCAKERVKIRSVRMERAQLAVGGELIMNCRARSSVNSLESGRNAASMTAGPLTQGPVNSLEMLGNRSCLDKDRRFINLVHCNSCRCLACRNFVVTRLCYREARIQLDPATIMGLS